MSPPTRPGPTLARRGFTDTQRAQTLLEDPALGPLADHREELVGALARAADPDAALLGLVRLLESEL